MKEEVEAEVEPRAAAVAVAAARVEVAVLLRQLPEIVTERHHVLAQQLLLLLRSQLQQRLRSSEERFQLLQLAPRRFRCL